MWHRCRTGNRTPSDVSDTSTQTLRRDWALFGTLTFLFGFGFAVYNGVFQNFLRDVIRADALQLGGLESLREVPGFLTAITAGGLVAFAEARVAGLGLAISGIGIGLTGVLHSYTALVLTSVFWSAGFHLYATVSPAITLALAKGKEGGRHLGRISAIGSAATLAALLFSWIAARMHRHPRYPGFFFLAGGLILVAALLSFRLSPHAQGAPRSRFVIRKEYGLYYLLIFLEGCRRQIFSIFASYTLILVYGVPLRTMLALQLVNAGLIWITAPAIGRLVDRRGERGPLTFYAMALIAIFAGYASVRHVGVLYALFLMDNILFTFSIGFTTYLHRIARPGDLTPCLAMGTTMNHMAAVIVPISGAWMWQHWHNYTLPFWLGAAIAIAALAVTRLLPSGPPALREPSVLQEAAGT
ncbi:MAG: MFS transporter [Chthonomonadales bacterium]